MMRAMLLMGILDMLAIGAPAGNGRDQVRTYRSPDGAVVARILSVSKAGRHPRDEDRVELRSQSGRVLAQRSYASWDGEHGYGVIQAAWTPNSRFFIWRLESSGGHSPWHSPVELWYRRRNRIYSLDRLLHDAIISSPFTVKRPDRVTLRVKGRTVIEGTPRTIRLERLLHKRTRNVR